MGEVLVGLPPRADADCRVLVLGSMPGSASLRGAQYYAHPRNRFWPVMGALCGFDPEAPYEARFDALRRAGVGVWDVIGRCERPGSLDAAIVRGSEVPNAIGDWLAAHPEVAAIALNGGKAADAFRRHVRPTLADPLPTLLALPSTSPAHAAKDVPALLDAWGAITPFLRRSS